MQFTSYLQDRHLTIALTGEIDHHYAKEFIDAIRAKIETYSPSVCSLDFREVTFMDSSGIAVVINTLRNVTRMDGKLILTGIPTQPMKVFQASGIDKLVEIKEMES